MIGRFRALAPDFPPAEYENVFTNARGERLVIAWRSAPVLDDAGRVVRIVAGGLDITERRKRELELERERDDDDRPSRRSRASPSCSIATARSATATSTTHASERTVRSARRSAGATTSSSGTHFLGLVVDDDGRCGGAAVATAAASGASEEVESELRCADGSVRAFLWTAVPVAPTWDGDVPRQLVPRVGNPRSTERRRLEVEKERERAFLNAIANNAPSMLCLIPGGRAASPREAGTSPSSTRSVTRRRRSAGRSCGRTSSIRPRLTRFAHSSRERSPTASRRRSTTTRGSPATAACCRSRVDVHPAARDRRAPPVPDHGRRHHRAQAHRGGGAGVASADREGRGRGPAALERNLHDGAQQRLVALSIALRLIETKLESDRAAAAELLAGARDELTHALEELRELARGIHPAILSDRGLRPALEGAGAWARLTSR